MKMIKIHSTLTLFLLLSSVFFIGCTDYESTQDENGSDSTAESKIPDGPVRIAFVPSVEAGEIELQLEAFEEKLGALIDHPVKANIVLSYSACIEQMAAGHFEAAMLPSLAYVLANERYGIKVALKAVRRGSPTYRGIIITRVDSGIDSIEDLRGRTFAFTDTASASGHLYPKTFLISMGIDPDVDFADYTFKGSHPAVVQSVLQGQVDAGACFEDARELLMDTEPTLMDETKIIGYTPGIPADTVSLRADLNGPFYEKLIDAMMELSREGEESVLYQIYEIEELVPAQDTDYDPIRQMVETLEYDIESELD